MKPWILQTPNLTQMLHIVYISLKQLTLKFKNNQPLKQFSSLNNLYKTCSAWWVIQHSKEWRMIFLEQSLYCVFANNKALTSLWRSFVAEEKGSKVEMCILNRAEQRGSGTSNKKKEKYKWKMRIKKKNMNEPTGLNVPSETTNVCCCV